MADNELKKINLKGKILDLPVSDFPKDVTTNWRGTSITYFNKPIIKEYNDFFIFFFNPAESFYAEPANNLLVSESIKYIMPGTYTNISGKEFLKASVGYDGIVKLITSQSQSLFATDFIAFFIPKI